MNDRHFHIDRHTHAAGPAEMNGAADNGATYPDLYRDEIRLRDVFQAIPDIVVVGMGLAFCLGALSTLLLVWILS